MPAYLIAICEVTNPNENFKEYAKRSGQLVAKHGGKYLARGPAARIIQGEAFTGRLVIVNEFPSMDDFNAFKEELFARLAPPETKQDAVTVEDETNEKATDDAIHEPPAEEPTVSQPKPRVEPERVLPKSSPVTEKTTSDGLFVLKEGTRVISSQIGRPLDKQTTENE